MQERGPKPRSRYPRRVGIFKRSFQTARRAPAIVDCLIRLLIALAVAAASAAGVALVLTIALAILGLYQSGHGGEARTETMVIDRGFAHLTIADVVLLAAIALAAGLAFALSYSHTKRAAPAPTEKKQP